jgi:hypothetical protein
LDLFSSTQTTALILSPHRQLLLTSRQRAAMKRHTSNHLSSSHAPHKKRVSAASVEPQEPARHEQAATAAATADVADSWALSDSWSPGVASPAEKACWEHFEEDWRYLSAQVARDEAIRAQRIAQMHEWHRRQDLEELEHQSRIRACASAKRA